MSNIFTSTDSRLVVKTNPAITFQSGMTLWLGKEGESVEISSHDWEIIKHIGALTSRIGKIPDSFYVTKAVESALSKTWWGKLYNRVYGDK
jgi:hypothetical protein